MNLLGKRGEILRSPGGSILVIEAFTERFEPFVHPIDVLVTLFLRDDVLDDSVLRIGQRLSAVIVGLGSGYGLSYPVHRERPFLASCLRQSMIC